MQSSGIVGAVEDCSICYSNQALTQTQWEGTLECECVLEYCHNCLSEWIVTEIKTNNLNADFKVRCPNQGCKKPYTLETYIKFLSLNSSEDLKDICEAALTHYSHHARDVRKCPNGECSNFGVIPLKACKDSLKCDQCATEWREALNYSTSEIVIKNLKGMLALNSEAFSILHNVVFEEPCPSCGVLIQKNGGCKHMVCGKCRHEFCWLCLGPYFGYVHSDNRYCPLRYTSLVGTMVTLIVVLNWKLFYHSVIYYTVITGLVYYIGGSLLMDLFVASMMFFIPLA